VAIQSRTIRSNSSVVLPRVLCKDELQQGAFDPLRRHSVYLLLMSYLRREAISWLKLHDEIMIAYSVDMKKKKPPPRPTDRPYRETYIIRASDKKTWIDKAEDLLHAASFLEPEVEKIYRSWKTRVNLLPNDQLSDTPIIREGIVEVYLMLVGCAFENLLKGVLVRRLTRGKKGNRISEPELPQPLKTHDVLSLAKELKLKLLSRQEVDLLKRLEEIIVWRGRYPVPKTYSAIRRFRLGTSPADDLHPTALLSLRPQVGNLRCKEIGIVAHQSPRSGIPSSSCREMVPPLNDTECVSSIALMFSPIGMPSSFAVLVTMPSVTPSPHISYAVR